MGLLNKAAKKETSAFSLDAMGRALKERLKKLPVKKTTPYTALSLLKAYGAFRAGICLVLKNNNYTSYASVGFGIRGMTFPREKIQPEKKAQDTYFKLDSSERLEIKNTSGEFDYWVFPLDKEEPWKHIMLLEVSDSSFNPEAISAILEDVTDKILLTADAAERDKEPSFRPAEPGEIEAGEAGLDEFLDGELDSPESENAGVDDPEEKIAEYSRKYPDFNCILLEIPGSGKDKAGFHKKVLGMIDAPGTVIPLAQDRSPLILFPAAVDRELIVHRLSKSLNTKPLLSFEAKNPEDVISRIQSLN